MKDDRAREGGGYALRPFGFLPTPSRPDRISPLTSGPKHFVKQRLPVRSVLVVDDNAAIRKAICELFTREADFEVCGEAENGREAIEKSQQFQPALIVTDLSMPLMNGLEETRILRKLMPAVPVIIYSVFTGAIVDKEALEAGASAVVSKSEAVTVLIGKARQLLDKIAA
jgi:DNA-binding NarL/FixJ family response regulator